jgi:hypothetical protein
MTNNKSRECCEGCDGLGDGRVSECVDDNCPCHVSQEKDEAPREWEIEFAERYGGWTMGGANAFIRNVEDAAREEERARLREKIEAHGHQQEDGTIWCNLDDILRVL